MTDTELSTLFNSYFTYNPTTGILLWKRRAANCVSIGTPAGSINTIRNRKRVCLHGKEYYNSRVIWTMVHGSIPPNMEVDHLNHNPLDNRLTNLRLVEGKENKKNLGMNSRNNSGFTGVHWCKTRKKWQACIRINGKSINLGRFTELDSAISARKAANLKYGFHPNHGT